jgi:hypothetical protein
MKLRGTCAVVVILSAILAISCSSGPKPPAVGSPAYYWAAAQETYAAGDYLKTAEHLQGVLKTDNEFTARAYPFYLVLTAAMNRAYADLAENFEYGMKANRANATAFRRHMNEHRTIAGRLALQFAEAFEKFETTNKEAMIPLAYSYPTGSAIPSGQLAKIAGGQLPQPAILEDVRRTHLQMHMLLSTTRAVGAPEDTAKTQDLFKRTPVDVPREIFFTEMANVLHDNAKLYAPAKLDDARRLEFFATHAMEALKPLPETKETKDLMAKIEKTMKLAKN